LFFEYFIVVVNKGEFADTFRTCLSETVLLEGLSNCVSC